MIDRKERRKQLVKWFLNTVMEEEANIQISADPYERTDKRKAYRKELYKYKSRLKIVQGFNELTVILLHYQGRRYMVAVGIIPAVIMLFLRRDIPESPRWLGNKGETEKYQLSSYACCISCNYVL